MVFFHSKVNKWVVLFSPPPCICCYQVNSLQLVKHGCPLKVKSVLRSETPQTAHSASSQAYISEELISKKAFYCLQAARESQYSFILCPCGHFYSSFSKAKKVFLPLCNLVSQMFLNSLLLVGCNYSKSENMLLQQQVLVQEPSNTSKGVTHPSCQPF